MTVFVDLLRIKEFREASANREVKVAEARLAERLRAVRDAEEALQSHHDFRVVEERRLFEEVKGEPVHVSRLDQMKQAVALLRDDERRLADKIEEERQTVPPAQKALAEAKDAYAKAMTATEKFRQFVAIQREAEAKEVAYREDAEAEEITEASLGARAAASGRR